MKKPTKLEATLIGLFALVVLIGAVANSTLTPFNSISVRQTNYVREEIVTNGLTLGGVRNTAWPAGGGLTNATPFMSNYVATVTNAASGLAALRTPTTLTYASVITLDFSTQNSLYLSLGGDVVITNSNLALGYGISMRVDNPMATNCNVVVPGWRMLQGTTTNILSPGASGTLWAFCEDTTTTNVLGSWSSQ